MDINRIEKEILKVVLKKELSEYTDAFYQCERGGFDEECVEYNKLIEGIKNNLILLEEYICLKN